MHSNIAQDCFAFETGIQQLISAMLGTYTLLYVINMAMVLGME
jgi:hypothetical protein